MGSAGTYPQRAIGPVVRMVKPASRVVVFGGTRGMGRSLARQFAERGDRVFLLGRNESDLRTSVADLDVRATDNARAAFAVCDLENPETFEPALDQAERELGGVDTVIVTAGLFATQDALEA